MVNLPEKTDAKPRKRRIAVALEIKAAALRIIEAEGAPMRVSGIDFLHVKWNGLNLMYTPKVPDDPPEFVEEARRSGIPLPPVTPRLLDISQGWKVFSIRWNDAGYFEVANFKRGEWESLLQSPATAH
jgi:hypothetical protein